MVHHEHGNADCIEVLRLHTAASLVSRYARRQHDARQLPIAEGDGSGGGRDGPTACADKPDGQPRILFPALAGGSAA